MGAGSWMAIWKFVVAILVLVAEDGQGASTGLKEDPNVETSVAVISQQEGRNGGHTLEILRAAQKKINEEEVAHCYPGNSETVGAYLNRKYDSFGLNGTETLVYAFCLKTRELGNKLGNYFTEVACAEASGLNFISAHKQWDISGAHTNMTSKDGELIRHSGAMMMESQRKAFLEALPDVIVHPTPVNSTAEGNKRVAELCKCGRYCWSEPDAPWVNNTAVIKKYLRKALHAYMDSSESVLKEGTTISPDTDMTNAPSGSFLPILPDVAIQYRCGDNIGFHYKYGLLPFFAMPPRIPKNAKHIYVLSDHPKRSEASTYTPRCQAILEGLFEYLKKGFPDSTIVVKRGGDLFLDYARLTFSNVTICSASTYCLWPAMAHEGVAYFPITSLVVGADNIGLSPPMPQQFKWIEDPLIISDLRKFRPWTALIDYLKGEAPRPAGT
jgi:hypothetical protein